MKLKLKRIEEGVCPYCGGSDIDYGSVELEDEMICYPATCNSYGRRFDEWYNLSFVGHNVGNDLDTITNAGDENVEIEMN